MSKIFETAQEIINLVQDEFKKTGLPQMGITLKVVSVTKQKQILKVAKASSTIEFLGKLNDAVILYIYEEAFDRMDDENRRLLIEDALSTISYDSDKDKIIITQPQINITIGGNAKYGERLVNACEISVHIMEEIEEESKDKKSQSKE